MQPPIHADQASADDEDDCDSETEEHEALNPRITARNI